jgi:hypothetical protein
MNTIKSKKAKKQKRTNTITIKSANTNIRFKRTKVTKTIKAHNDPSTCLPSLKHLQIFSIEMVAIWMQMIGWKRWFAETLLVLIPISMNLIELKPLSFKNNFEESCTFN